MKGSICESAVELLVANMKISMHRAAGNSSVEWDDPKIALDKPVLRDLMENSLFNVSSGKYYGLTRSGNKLVTRSKEDFWGSITSEWGMPLEDDVVSVLAGEGRTAGKRTAILKATRDSFLEFIRAERQFEEYQEAVCVYQEEAALDYDDRLKVCRYIQPHKPFKERAYDQSIVDDYKLHFPELDDVIALIAAARCSSNAKQAYLWLHCGSDWGKNVFTSMLGELNTVTRTSTAQLKKMLKGEPVGKNLTDFMGKLVLHVDEFKSSISEIKELDSEVTLSPKGMLEVTTPLYVKLFTSAEHVESLAGESGVDAQFCNRFNYIAHETSITERRKVVEVGIPEYIHNCSAYIAEVLNRHIERITSQGDRLKCQRLAQEIVGQFHEKYGIGLSYGSLQEAIPAYAERIRAYLIDEVEEAVKARKRFDSEPLRMIHRARNTRQLYLSASKRVVKQWLRDNLDPAEYRTVSYKAKDIVQHLSIGGAAAKKRRFAGGEFLSIQFR